MTRIKHSSNSCLLKLSVRSFCYFKTENTASSYNTTQESCGNSVANRFPIARHMFGPFPSTAVIRSTVDGRVIGLGGFRSDNLLLVAQGRRLFEMGRLLGTGAYFSSNICICDHDTLIKTEDTITLT